MQSANKWTSTVLKAQNAQDNDGDAADAAEDDMNDRERFRVFTFCSITDKLSSEMERRSQVYKDVSKQFSFLNNLKLNEEECSTCCSNLVSF